MYCQAVGSGGVFGRWETYLFKRVSFTLLIWEP